MSIKAKSKENVEAIYSWIKLIEELIDIHSFKVPDEKCRRTIQSWVYQVVHMYLNQFNIAKLSREKPKREPDGNIALAIEIGMIFFAWGYRTLIAKTYREENPSRDKRKNKEQMLRIITDIIQLIDIEPNRMDKLIYRQNWDK